MTDDSWRTFIPKHINHESPLEHVVVSVVLICSRAIQQELTRHRLASYSIESTRWIDYFKKQGGTVDFIQPSDWADFTQEQRDAYLEAMLSSEKHYNNLRALGLPAQRARDAFALGLKGEIYMTANVRQWRHIFRERHINQAAHKDIRQLTGMISEELLARAPVFFQDVYDPKG